MKRFLLLLFVMILASCGKNDGTEKLEKSVASWSATLEFVAHARLEEQVSAAFAMKTIDAASEDVSTQMAAPALKDTTLARAHVFVSTGTGLRRAFELDDHSAIVREMRALGAGRRPSK